MTTNRKLKSLYGTTEPDLEANRNGEITPRQVQWLHGKRGENQIKGGCLFLLSMGLAAVGGYQTYLYYTNPIGNPPVLWIILLIAGGLLAIILPIAVRRENDNMSEDINEGRLEQQAGVCSRSKRVVRNKYGSQTYYYVSVGSFNMGAVDEATYDAFLNDHCYRVYFLPRSRQIVSVEMIDCMEMSAPPKAKAKNEPETETPLNKETSYLVYTLRGQGTYDAAIKWYVAKDKPARVAWQKQSDDVTTLNREALQRLPKVQREMQNQGWEFTNEKDEGEIADKATFRRVYTMERVRVESETG